MNNFERIAIPLIILFVIKMIFGYSLSYLFLNFFGQTEIVQYNLNKNLLSILEIGLEYIVNIFLAVWIYKQAKKENVERKEKLSPITWVFLTLFFGLLSVVLYYLIILVYEIKEWKKENL